MSKKAQCAIALLLGVLLAFAAFGLEYLASLAEQEPMIIALIAALLGVMGTSAYYTITKK